MKKIKILLLTLIFIGLKSYSQDLTCADFKKGTFSVPSIIEGQFITVVREENTQIEYSKDLPNEPIQYEIIEWIDECTYRLKYDESKMELTDQKKWINSSNGIVVSELKIEGKCMYYKAVLDDNGKEIRFDGKICAE